MPALERPSAISASTSLARSQPVQRVGTATAQQQLGNDLRVKGCPACRNTLERIHELLDVRDALLEQVADTARLRGEQVGRVPLLDILREEQHRRVGPLPPDHQRGPHALVTETGRHPYIDQGELGLVLLDRREQRIRVVRLGGHLEARHLEDLDQADS